MRAVPTEEDWGDWSNSGDFDLIDAHDAFAGKTNQEMQSKFYRNVMSRSADLRWMPKIPFQYYVLGFRDFVLAGRFAPYDSSDAASGFLILIELMLKELPDYIVPVMPHLIEAIKHVAEHQEEYEADEDIYGNFQDKRRRIEEIYGKYT